MYERIQIPLLSLADICREICSCMGADVLLHEGRYMTYPVPGFLYARNFIPEAGEEELDAILKEIKGNLSKGLPGSVNVTEERMPENYREIFEKNGFTRFLSQTGMIFNLEKGFPEEIDEKIALMRDDQMIEWSQTVAAAFPKPREDDPFIALNKSSKVLTYGYMEGEKIAATGLLMVDPELAGIHEIGTLPDFRQKGMGTQIIIRMLQDLKSRGIRTVSLQASDLGRDYVYTPLGFETVSTIPTWVPAG